MSLPGFERIYQDGTYLKQNPGWHEEDSSYKAQDVIRLINRNRLKLQSVGEVGSGSGEVLRQLAQHLPGPLTFSGYEISPQAFALCRAKQTEKIHYFLKDLLAEDVHFDMVLALDVFEHIPDYLYFLSQLRTKGRYKIFRIPLNLSVQSVLLKSRPILAARKSFGHLHYFTKETAIATLEDTGYHIIDLFYTFSPISRESLGWPRYLLKSLKRIGFALHQEWLARLLDGFSLMVLAE
jgi:2-polyprenyl-3-methyl-5-hydroxy-6-metoxy-1,4-benzoquinol methylase